MFYDYDEMLKEYYDRLGPDADQPSVGFDVVEDEGAVYAYLSNANGPLAVWGPDDYGYLERPDWPWILLTMCS